MLFLATLLNYMDRQTLSQSKPIIWTELSLTADNSGNELYGNLELGFGLAFAFGAVFFGVLADKINVYYLYPFVLVGWSLAGIATGQAHAIGVWFDSLLISLGRPPIAYAGVTQEAAQTYLGLLVCRVVLGIFESGQWPCALVTTQRLLSSRDRPLGNSILQAGASIGAVCTPLVMQVIVDPNIRGSWTTLFYVIGAGGLLWLFPWFLITRPVDLARPAESPLISETSLGSLFKSPTFLRRLAAAFCIVVTINLTWHFYRAWLPTFLKDIHNYQQSDINYLVAGFNLVTDIGCLAVGPIVLVLTSMQVHVHWARVLTFVIAALLVSVTVVIGATTGVIMVALILTASLGALAMFPLYYSFSQELTSRGQGKITGILSCSTWIITSLMHKGIGMWIDYSKSYTLVFLVVGLAPLFGLAGLLLLWDRPPAAVPKLAAENS